MKLIMMTDMAIQNGLYFVCGHQHAWIMKISIDNTWEIGQGNHVDIF